MDIESYQEEVHLDWITLLAYAAVRGGGEFDDKSLKYIDEIAAELTSQTVSREDWRINISILIITMRHMVLY